MGRPRRFRAPAPDPLERDIQAAVFEHWQKLGRPLTFVACIPNALAHGQAGLTKGLPDLLVMGPDIPSAGHVAFMELKRRKRKDTRSRRTETEEAQSLFSLLCAQLGVLCPMVYGRDEPIEYLENWNVVRRQAYPEPPGWDRRFEVDWPP